MAKQKGAFYNIFKSKPELLALFDVCKTLEEDKSLFSNAGVTDSTDESNNAGEDESSLGLESARILPLDPAMKDVRFLGLKPDHAP